jgi:hypothetical protein
MLHHKVLGQGKPVVMLHGVTDLSFCALQPTVYQLDLRIGQKSRDEITFPEMVVSTTDKNV